ncbi:MAG: hypothetical protein K8F91_24225 [Candidatus Obscuribacterales bacterium]|nr:hypothetical protein [Candidatus Obscuribacterales bacterium]
MNENGNSRDSQETPHLIGGSKLSGFQAVKEGNQSRPTTVKRALGVWIVPFTRLHKIPVFRKVWLYLLVMTVYTFAVQWIAEEGQALNIFKEATNVAYLSAIFGLLLVFRTNSAYERWWEGRRLWGQLVNDSRNLCLKTRSYVDVPNREKIRLGELVVSFAFSLKHHLRDTRPTRDLPGLEPIVTISEKKHLPAHVTAKIFDMLQEWLEDGHINDFKLMLLDQHARAFMDICGACERIKNTPLAVSYRAFMRQGIGLNLVIIPWYVIPQLGLLWSMPVVLISSYFLIGLELIAEDIEEPFGEDGDDLPLDTICNGIQKSISEILPVDSKQKFTSSIKLPDFDPLKYTASVKTLPADPLKDDD